MARVRSPNRDKAYEIYKLNNGEILLKDIATQLGVKDTQVRKWKSQDKWEEKLKGTLPKEKRNVNNKKVTKKKAEKQADFNEVESVLENTELTEKQRLFCIYYIEDFNATRAYRKVYGCSYNTAKTEGSKCLTKPNIKLEIDRLTEECLQEQEINSKLLNKRLFQKYMNIAFSDITDFLEFNSEKVEGEFGPYLKNSVVLKDSTQLDGTLISEISEGKDGVKVKLLDKMKALDWLDKHIGLASEEQKARIENIKAKTNKITGDNTEVEDTSETDSDIYGCD
ncbi:terminase small subunit [Terrisporobacter glycolicus]|uniref:PBSX phage terminase small subunit-like N-terminal domain-containing protein n=1 Tax=Terrisporobacter glycolicus ATCC 14880 = DSM 1288 TaxID=1121315 RepID=A0ABZ2EWL5_9FIRM|nr:terminase small subunit [Terrisporobacter glycolicus]